MIFGFGRTVEAGSVDFLLDVDKLSGITCVTDVDTDGDITENLKEETVLTVSS